MEIYIKKDGIEFEKKEANIKLSPGQETSFQLVIKNEGEPTHFHLSTDLRNIIFLKESSYIKKEEKIPVLVRLPKDQSSGKGKISILTRSGKRGSFMVNIFSGKEMEKEKVKIGIQTYPFILFPLFILIFIFILFDLFFIAFIFSIIFSFVLLFSIFGSVKYLLR
jgi:hypothetical protein